MSDVNRYEAVHLRYDDNNIRYGDGCEVEVVLASDYATLEAENAKLRAELERRVPDGWKLVPVDPTEAMVLNESGCKHHAWDDKSCAARKIRFGVWAKMLAAAPSAPATVPDAIAMADVMRAWEYAEDHPHKYLRGTTNWCAAVAYSLNQQRVAAPYAPKADPVKVQMMEALEHARIFIRNGIDLGCIRMPDADTPDPAHETLPMIEAAIAAARQEGGKV